MKIFGFTILIFSFFGLQAFAQVTSGANEVSAFRERRDRQFRVRQQSPLTDEDFTNFKGLNYFPFDEKFVATAKFEKSAEQKFFQMPTSIGMSEKYAVAGVLKFELGGVGYQLTAYQSETVAAGKYPAYKNILFVPFRDLTNGKETYGAGRFLDIRVTDAGEAILNFNLAYNPNCVYGDKFACPVPPRENFLQVKIAAGEKNFSPVGKKQSSAFIEQQ